MEGRVSSGFGEAAGFVAEISGLDVAECGFEPFPGTFNLAGDGVPDGFPR